MARVIPGSGGEIYGSIGSLTYSRNRYGNYVKRRPFPRQPNNTAQQNARSRFVDAATSWRSLSDGERAAWDSYAANTKTRLPDGRVDYITGAAWYLAVKAFAGLVDPAISVSAPPAMSGVVAQPHVVDLTIVSGELSGLNTPSGASHVAIWIQAAGGRSVASGQWTLAFSGLASPTGYSLGDYVVAGQRYFVKCRFADLSSVNKCRISDVAVFGPVLAS